MASAHIALYAQENAPIGQFEALPYLPERGEWQDVHPLLRRFFEAVFLRRGDACRGVADAAAECQGGGPLGPVDRVVLSD